MPGKKKTTFEDEQDKNSDGEGEQDDSEEAERKRLEEEEKQKQEEENAKKRQEQAVLFEQYIEQSGMPYAFQIIFTEIIAKQIREDQVFAYTAMRLRQIGSDLDNLGKGM